MYDEIIIIDFGSQLTQVIARRIREFNLYSIIYAPENFESLFFNNNIKGIILSGSYESIQNYDKYSDIITRVVEYNKKYNVPILGICFGYQLICKYFGSSFKTTGSSEFGCRDIIILENCLLTKNQAITLNKGDIIKVWMSHNDSPATLPRGFKNIAKTNDNDFAIISNDEQMIYGIHYHPEVSHSNFGKEILNNFLYITGAKRNWSIENFILLQKKAMSDIIGNENVIAAVSGGVDSTVAATFLHQIIKKNLYCIFIDTGLLRKNEVASIQKYLGHLNLIVIDESEFFLKQLEGIVDPEEKRKIIGKCFIMIFEREAKKIGNIKFLMQGTLYPDIIESGVSSSKKIKSHHNVGGLPDIMNLALIEPLKFLFKDEVRILGAEFNLPYNVLYRHPFPGPGLAVRIIGEVTREKINILQDADDIVITLLKKYNLYHKIWQAFVVFLPIKTVGVMGDERTYGYTLALRAVTSIDGMTADAVPFENFDVENKLLFFQFLQEASTEIVNKISSVNRVVYDITSKPPATIEWE